MGKIASQITSLMIVYSTFYSDADQRKYRSSASLAFVRAIHRGPVNSPHTGPVTRKMFPFDDVIMLYICCNFVSVSFKLLMLIFGRCRSPVERKRKKNWKKPPPPSWKSQKKYLKEICLAKKKVPWGTLSNQPVHSRLHDNITWKLRGNYVVIWRCFNLVDKDARMDTDLTSIRRFSVGSMLNRCRSEHLAYLGSYYGPLDISLW